MKGFATLEKQIYRKQLGWVQEGICNYRKTKLWNTIRLSRMRGFATLGKKTNLWKTIRLGKMRGFATIEKQN